jgi:hypothetical protein
MTDTNTNEKVAPTKKEQVEFDVQLFTEYAGPRTYTDKRFPGGRIRIYLPAPVLDAELLEDANELAMKYYNKSVQDLFDAGIVQNAYGERDWTNISLRGKTRPEIVKESKEAMKIAGVEITEASVTSWVDEKILDNIQKSDGIGPLDDDIENVTKRIRAFFEAAVFTEKKERVANTTKIVAKKLKSAGIADISDDEIAAIIAARKAKA